MMPTGPAIPWCCACGRSPAKMMLPTSGLRICGVCAHQLAVAQDLARRIVAVKRRAPGTEARA